MGRSVTMSRPKFLAENAARVFKPPRGPAGGTLSPLPLPAPPPLSPVKGGTATVVAMAGAQGADEPLHRALGLTDDEFEAVEAVLGRAPNHLELALYAVMWSEHCSYKSSRRPPRGGCPPRARGCWSGRGRTPG